MTPRDFCYWLQGFLEVGRPETLDATQVQQLRDHLNLVFEQVTPERYPRDMRLCGDLPAVTDVKFC